MIWFSGIPISFDLVQLLLKNTKAKFQSGIYYLTLWLLLIVLDNILDELVYWF